MSPIGGFATALRRLIFLQLRHLQEYQELAALTDRQLEDIGLTRDELVLAVAGAAEAPERVGMMTSRLGIAPEALEAGRPLLNEMVRRCAACRTKLICAWWLAEGDGDDRFREFCPNAGRFVELRHRAPRS